MMDNLLGTEKFELSIVWGSFTCRCKRFCLFKDYGLPSWYL